MQSGAVSFLQRHGFNFSAQFLQGVPYLSVQEESQARINMAAEAKRQDMDLKPEDDHLVQHIRDSIAKWQAQPKDEQEDYLNIPNTAMTGFPRTVPRELNNYHKRLVHQIVQNEFPAMRTQGMGHFVQITDPTDGQQQSERSLEEERRERDLGRAVGFRWLLDGLIGKDLSNIPEDYLLAALPSTTKAMDGERPVQSLRESLNQKLKTRRKVLVGHNCTTDLLYLYKLVVGDLPGNLANFLKEIHDMFPAIIDTKFLANSHSEKLGRITLGEVEVDLQDETGMPDIVTPPEFDRYTNEAFYHEAGYDSYITAIVAIKMAAKLNKEGTARKKQQEEQEKKLAVAEARSPPEFGMPEGYMTTTESASSKDNNVFASSAASARHGNLSESLSRQSNPDTLPSASSALPSSSNIVAVKAIKPTSAESHPSSTETSVEKVRSAFSSATIYDSLDTARSRSSSAASSDPVDAKMPGDTPPQSPSLSLLGRVLGGQSEKPLTREDLDRMVVQGLLMPRWKEEKAFWDVYGNRLQCNGTQEGVMRIV